MINQTSPHVGLSSALERLRGQGMAVWPMWCYTPPRGGQQAGTFLLPSRALGLLAGLPGKEEAHER